MHFELWDVTVNRHLGEFAREGDALREALALIEHFGEAHAENLVLVGAEDDEGLTGAALAARARALVPVPAG